MSSMETIDELHKQRMQLQAAIDLHQLELDKCKKDVAELEAQILAMEDGDEGILIRVAQFIEDTIDMDTLKKQSDNLLKNVEALLDNSADFQQVLHDHLLDWIQTMNGTDKRGPQKDGQTFQQKLDEASAKLKE